MITRRENTLFALAFGLALTFRLLHLGQAPLSDSEARLALQALQIASGIKPEFAPAGAYINLTALMIFLFTATNYAVRIIPALAGSLLVLAPYFFRARLGTRPAIVLAFALAFDPGMVSISRMAGSSILAVSFVVLAWAFWPRNPRWAGIFGGLALLAGPALWPGLLGLGVTTLALMGRKNPDGQDSGAEAQEWRTAILFGLGSFLIAGTLILYSPGGLGAAVSSLVTYFQGWVNFSDDIPVSRLVAALLSSAPMAVGFGLFGLLRGLRAGDERSIRLGVWVGIAMVLALAYPSRQPGDLAWAIIPLWALAAQEISRHLDIESFEGIRWEVTGMFALTLAVLTFAWFILGSLGRPLAAEEYLNRQWIFLGSFVLLALCAVMVGYGWSVNAARLGSVWGLIVALSIYTFGSAWNAPGLRVGASQDLWSPGPATDANQLAALVQTVDDLSEWSKGVPVSQMVSVQGVQSSALVWALRGRPVETLEAVDPTSSAPIIIAPNNPDVAFAAKYRGEDFALRDYAGWDTATLQEWIRWVTTREMSVGQDGVILWARNDIFIDGKTNP